MRQNIIYENKTNTEKRDDLKKGGGKTPVTKTAGNRKWYGAYVCVCVC